MEPLLEDDADQQPKLEVSALLLTMKADWTRALMQ